MWLRFSSRPVQVLVALCFLIFVISIWQESRSLGSPRHCSETRFTAYRLMDHVALSHNTHNSGSGNNLITLINVLFWSTHQQRTLVLWPVGDDGNQTVILEGFRSFLGYLDFTKLQATHCIFMGTLAELQQRKQGKINLQTISGHKAFWSKSPCAHRRKMIKTLFAKPARSVAAEVKRTIANLMKGQSPKEFVSVHYRKMETLCDAAWHQPHPWCQMKPSYITNITRQRGWVGEPLDAPLYWASDGQNETHNAVIRKTFHQVQSYDNRVFPSRSQGALLVDVLVMARSAIFIGSAYSTLSLLVLDIREEVLGKSADATNLVKDGKYGHLMGRARVCAENPIFKFG
jgi:hypothetical protein